MARFDWLLFLDADDWLSPLHLGRMTGVLSSDPGLDAVHCGYVFGLSCQPDLSRFQDSLLALPRIEVTGSDSLQEFVAKLNP